MKRSTSNAHGVSRREFIYTSGLALAGLTLLPGCSTSEKNTRYGLQLYTLRDQLAADLQGTLKAVAGIGYQDLEVFGYGDGKIFGVTPSELKTMVENLGMRLVSGHYLTGKVGVTSGGTLTNGWERAVEDAQKMGLQYMVCAYLFPEERQSADDYRSLAHLLNQAGEVTRQAGIQFGYHNHDFEFTPIDGQMPAYLLFDGTEEDLVVAEMDIYWIHKSEINPVHFFKKYPKRTVLWHVKDMAGSAEGEFTEVGNGVIDFPSIFAESSLAGMKHFFVEQDICKKPPLESIGISYKNLKKWGI